MSEIKDQVKAEFKANMEKDESLAKKKAEYYEKKLLVDDRRVNLELERQAEIDHELELARSTSFGAMSDKRIDKIRRESAEYMEAAKQCMVFINEEFKSMIPMFRKNLIFFGGRTGEGKSTTVANIVSSIIGQRDPATGRRRRALVLTNEEKAEDVYNRITCNLKGWHYTNHDKFTAEQIKTFDLSISHLAKGGLVSVYDDSSAGGLGLTTTIEGIQQIFENLLRDKEYYDVVIIDYYQNVKESRKFPELNEYQVQAKLSNLLDRMKNLYPAPIIVMGQIKPPDKENNVLFEFRIKGSKTIHTVSTCAVEIIADRENLRTQWMVHKGRFTEAVGKEGFFTGYDKGKYVKYDVDFMAKVNVIKEERAQAKIEKLCPKDEKKKDKS